MWKQYQVNSEGHLEGNDCCTCSKKSANACSDECLVKMIFALSLILKEVIDTNSHNTNVNIIRAPNDTEFACC